MYVCLAKVPPHQSAARGDRPFLPLCPLLGWRRRRRRWCCRRELVTWATSTRSSPAKRWLARRPTSCCWWTSTPNSSPISPTSTPSSWLSSDSVVGRQHRRLAWPGAKRDTCSGPSNRGPVAVLALKMSDLAMACGRASSRVQGVDSAIFRSGLSQRVWERRKSHS